MNVFSILGKLSRSGRLASAVGKMTPAAAASTAMHIDEAHTIRVCGKMQYPKHELSKPKCAQTKRGGTHCECDTSTAFQIVDLALQSRLPLLLHFVAVLHHMVVGNQTIVS